jgi:hypothetical protein
MPYVPPHLRPGYVPSVPKPAEPAKPKRRGAHFKSTETGYPSHNITEFRYNRNAPFLTQRNITKFRLLSKKQPTKSALKTTKKTLKRKAASLDNKKRTRHNIRAKSK